MKSKTLSPEKPEWRKNLKEYYSKIRVCKLCHLEYGLDRLKEKENLICPRCCITPNKYFFD